MQSPASDLDATQSSHDWVWSREKGNWVWVAVAEPLVKADSLFQVDIVGEFLPLPDILMPQEMEVVANWALHSEEGESHILCLRSPKRYGFRYCCQCKNGMLADFFIRHAEENLTPSSIFANRNDCLRFCRKHITDNFFPKDCDALLKTLSDIAARVRGVKGVCIGADRPEGAVDFSEEVRKILD